MVSNFQPNRRNRPFRTVRVLSFRVLWAQHLPTYRPTEWAKGWFSVRDALKGIVGPLTPRLLLSPHKGTRVPGLENYKIILLSHVSLDLRPFLDEEHDGKTIEEDPEAEGPRTCHNRSPHGTSKRSSDSATYSRSRLDCQLSTVTCDAVLLLT